jgi:hypothetical protein
MAKETKHESEAREEPKGERGKKPRKHLHQIITEEAHDGTFTHHHVYKAKKGDMHSEMPRLMATSSSPEEAGEHTAEQFGMNHDGGTEGEGEPQEAEGGAQPGPQGGEGEPEEEA